MYISHHHDHSTTTRIIGIVITSVCALVLVTYLILRWLKARESRRPTVDVRNAKVWPGHLEEDDDLEAAYLPPQYGAAEAAPPAYSATEGLGYRAPPVPAPMAVGPPRADAYAYR